MNKLTVRLISSFVVIIAIIVAIMVIGFKSSDLTLLAGANSPTSLNEDKKETLPPPSPIPSSTSLKVKETTHDSIPTIRPTNTPVPTATPTATTQPTVTPTPKQIVVQEIKFNPNEINGQNGLLALLQQPTATWTAAPHTVLVPTDALTATEVEDHLWFERPFPEPYGAWGSFNYPYGTNGHGEYLWHFGVDIQGEGGKIIQAIGDGFIAFAGTDLTAMLGPYNDFYGQAVVIKHDELWNGQTVYTLYGHVSQSLVEAGQHVKTGEPIAKVGQSGIAMGNHLHLEVRVGGNTYNHTRNPDLWVRPDPGYGVITGRVMDKQGYFVPVQLVTLHFANQSPSFWRETYTYPDNLVNYDDKRFENFSFSDVPVGDYFLKSSVDGQELIVPITVKEYSTSFALFQQK